MSDAQNVVQHCIKIGLEYDPPKEILEYCGAYYSPYYNFAYAMMCAAGTYWPSVVAVELGVEKARCSFSMLQYENGIVIGLDTHPTVEASRLALREPRFIYLNQPSSQVPVNILEHKRISILHIDTEHSYGMAKMEFEAYFPYLTNPAFVLFDDIHAMNDDVLKFVKELPYYKVIEDRLHPICGYAVVAVET